MEELSQSNTNERTYTQSEMENIIRNVVRQMDIEKEERTTGKDIPVEISEELGDTPWPQLQENFKKFKRDTKRYNLDEWTTPEKINKSVLSYLKRHTTETTQVVQSIYKITDNTRFQARVAMELFEELQWVLHEASTQAEARTVIEKCVEQSKRLAIFGLATAKAQEREAKEYSDKALRIPNSIKHLETTEEDTKTKNAYSNEFLTEFHRATFEQRILQQASGQRGGGRGNGFSRGNYQRGGGRPFRNGRGSGSRGSFFGQAPSSAGWGNTNKSANQPNQTTNPNNNQ